ncbi:LPXTG cell wall anchor domain-containing protein [Microlunatus elymi]|uniref:LPXTG cell wall anchor domain-containing protein n=1 Tax=Microlunatus elymi TaxID=2596828 RepID=A0A516PTQ6_9ACTN|nr:LPXTG cell wall anchor domain-containing protein [Microlunatus elymi]QDP94519.1 LPXTG cell wall anchor domain-containing protein [Microlunatus elymi]
MKIIWRAGIALAITTGLLTALPSAPAHAQDEVLLSRDRHSWAPGLDRPLFDPTTHWVPGDVAESAFWVRNAAVTAGTLGLALNVDAEDRLLRTGIVRITARVAGSDWVALVPDGVQQRLDPSLPSGAETKIIIRVRYRWSADNSTQYELSPLNLRVTLTQSTATDHRPPTGHAHPPLPHTGNMIAGWLAPVGGLLIGVGLVLVLVRSRRPRRTGGDRG